jgi:hypothetical protein
MPRSFADHVKLVNKRHGEGKSKCAIIQEFKEYEEYKEFKEEPGVRIQESGGHGAWRVVERASLARPRELGSDGAGLE